MDEQLEMTDVSIIARKAIDLIESSIKSEHENRRTTLPNILNSPGRWVASYSQKVIALFYLDKYQIERTVQCHNEGINPFAGFIAPDDVDVSVAIQVNSANNVFISNIVSNMYSFRASQEASFIVLNHTQEFTDLSGREIKYTIDMAFVLGLRENETWDSTAVRILQLYDYFVLVWLRDHGNK